MVKNYAVLDPQGRIVNIILWDGDETTWSPVKAYGAGYTAREAAPDDVIWTASE